VMLRSCGGFLCTLVVLVLVAIIHYKNETWRDRVSARLQCGHIAFIRSTQLLGLPIDEGDVRRLPSRNAGVSLADISKALLETGLDCKIGFNKKIVNTKFRGPLIVQIDNPGHFVVIEDFDDQSVFVYENNARPKLISRGSISRQFTGYYARVRRSDISQDRALGSGFPVFDSLIKDCGEIEATTLEAGKITFDFVIKNEGATPLVIKDVSTSCACLETRYPTKPLAPGDEGRVSVDYHLRLGNSDGVFQQNMFLFTNSIEMPAVALQVGGQIRGVCRFFPAEFPLGNILRPERKVERFLFVTLPPSSDQKELEFDFVVPEKSALMYDFKNCDINYYNDKMRNLDPVFIPLGEANQTLVFVVTISARELVGYTMVQDNVNIVNRRTGLTEGVAKFKGMAGSNKRDSAAK